jgi:hypothetical protein
LPDDSIPFGVRTFGSPTVMFMDMDPTDTGKRRFGKEVLPIPDDAIGVRQAIAVVQREGVMPAGIVDWRSSQGNLLNLHEAFGRSTGEGAGPFWELFLAAGPDRHPTTIAHRVDALTGEYLGVSMYEDGTVLAKGMGGRDPLDRAFVRTTALLGGRSDPMVRRAAEDALARQPKEPMSHLVAGLELVKSCGYPKGMYRDVCARGLEELRLAAARDAGNALAWYVLALAEARGVDGRLAPLERVFEDCARAEAVAPPWDALLDHVCAGIYAPWDRARARATLRKAAGKTLLTPTELLRRYRAASRKPRPE